MIHIQQICDLFSLGTEEKAPTDFSSLLAYLEKRSQAQDTSTNHTRASERNAVSAAAARSRRSAAAASRSAGARTLGALALCAGRRARAGLHGTALSGGDRASQRAEARVAHDLAAQRLEGGVGGELGRQGLEDAVGRDVAGHAGGGEKLGVERGELGVGCELGCQGLDFGVGGELVYKRADVHAVDGLGAGGGEGRDGGDEDG
jgi:hypothetical protein